MDKSQHSVRNDPVDDSFVFVASGQLLFDEKRLLYIQKRYHLTNRELQVANLISQGFNNEDIAAKLKITRGTVKTHIRNVYRRVRVKNKIQMVLKFVDVVTKLSAKSVTTSAIPIVEIKRTDKKTSDSSNISKKA